MDLAIFQNIREKLLSTLAQKTFFPHSQEALGVGAAGDRTFPIDEMAEEIIISVFEHSGLPLSLVSEEYGLKELRGGGRKVLIDPIDGSKNAISGIPFYCTSIAVAEGDTIGSVYSAYVLNLITGDEFHAEKGRGAFLNSVRISSQKDEKFSLVAYEAQTPGKDIPRIVPLLSQSRKTRCLGATALDLAYLACGAVSVFISPSPSRSFDFAGGWLLAREAGGVFTDMNGHSIEDIAIGLGKATPLLASGNPGLHALALRLLNE